MISLTNLIRVSGRRLLSLLYSELNSDDFIF